MYKAVHSTLIDEGPAVLATIIRGLQDMLGRELLLRDDGTVTGSLGNEWDEKVLKLAGESLSQGTSRRVTLSEEVEIFFEAILPSPALVIVGGVHIAIALASLAKTLGYRTIMIDPRNSWGNADRFPHVDQLIQAWPNEAFSEVHVTRSTAVVMLTHDPKLDDPAVKIALASAAFYVGALGSKSTQAKRRERLSNEGVPESQLSGLHAPIGLDIGAQSPEEIALAIMAEVVQAFRKQGQHEAKAEADLHPTA
jgi:xanthine dehydrogenase accessory factor